PCVLALQVQYVMALSASKHLVLALVVCFKYVFNRTLHIKHTLRNVIDIAIQQHTETTYCVFNRDVFAFKTCELFRNLHWLAEEVFDLTRTAIEQFIVVSYFFYTENGDDVLQVLVTLEYLLYFTG